MKHYLARREEAGQSREESTKDKQYYSGEHKGGKSNSEQDKQGETQRPMGTALSLLGYLENFLSPWALKSSYVSRAHADQR